VTGAGSRRWGAVLAVLLLVCWPTLAQAAGKFALVIANADYKNAGRLANPESDGRIVADAARRAGFDEVTIVANSDLATFRHTLRDFRARASGAEVAMIYYAGHGIEGSGKNWLLPTDARLASNLDLPYEAIDLDLVMEAISAARIRIVVLDACRNNPFGRGWRSGTRSLSRGLGGVEVDDVLVIYAAAPGQTAADGEGDNSPFAQSFARRLTQRDIPIQLLGGLVRDDVLAATAGQQRPFVSASITGTPVYLQDRRGRPATRLDPALPPPSPAGSSLLAARDMSGAAPPRVAGARNDYKRGDWVLARGDGGFWFPGVVEDAEPNLVGILFDDQSRGTRPVGAVKPYDWKQGTRLSCAWTGDGKYYDATIVRLGEADKVSVRFTDGVVEETLTGRCRSRE
jgi:hypothetical protein